MTRRRHRNTANQIARRVAGGVALVGLLVVTGCNSLAEPRESFLGDADLNYYVGRATTVASPDVKTVASDNVATLPPHTIADRSHDAIRDLTLTEAIHLSLSNSEVIRERGQFLSPTNPLLNTPEFVNSIYDPAIQNTSIQFGQRGVEAALSDFDALFTTQMLWGREEQIQNSLFGFGQEPGQTLQQDTGQFISRLEKPIATGGLFGVSHTVNYDYNNAQNRLFDSVYTGNVQAEFRHPLMAGFGVDVNRIAGPQVRSVSRQVQFTNGVLMARINNDVEIAEFQRAARNLVREVEEAYWNLALAYRVYDAEVIARDSSLQIWRFVNTRTGQGIEGTGSADLAQAKESYLDARSRAESALADLYRRELELRRITGLPVNDGSVLRPIEEPVTARFTPDWYASLCEALTSRVELRRQKWQIKSLELQLIAAKNLAQPSLDFVSRYRVNGFGDKLLSGSDDDSAGTTQGLDNFYNNILQDSQTGWDLGFELSVPVGLRSAKSQVRWYELRIAKARATLATMEHEISHELGAAFQEVERFHKVAQTNLNRRAAAEERLQALQTRYELGLAGGEGGGQTTYLDLLLRSQIGLAQAEITYWQAIISYNQAIADVHLREGTLLERNGISLAEGSWTPQAYRQALRESWRRSHAFHNPLLDTEPDPFAIPGEKFPTAVPDIGAAILPVPEQSMPLVPPPPPAAAPPPDPQPSPNDEPDVLFQPPYTSIEPTAGTSLGSSQSSQVVDTPTDATPVPSRSKLSNARLLRGVNR